MGAALVHGSGSERIATVGCFDGTIRRRLHEWAEAGLAETWHRLVLEHYDRIIRLDQPDIVVDGWITKAPCGGRGRRPLAGGPGKEGPETVERDRRGRWAAPHRRSRRQPARCPAARSHTLDGVAALKARVPGSTVHLDRGYAGQPTRTLLDALGLEGAIARKGGPAPIQAGQRWVVARTQAWMNGYGKLRRCTAKTPAVVDC